MPLDLVEACGDLMVITAYPPTLPCDSCEISGTSDRQRSISRGWKLGSACSIAFVKLLVFLGIVDKAIYLLRELCRIECWS